MLKTVSIYIPAYNAGKHIKLCLESVFKQTYPVTEVIVVDDGSTDNTVEVSRKFGVNLISHPYNMGLAVSRNTAIKSAAGEFIAAVDSDCVLDPKWLWELMKNLSNEKIAGAGGILLENHSGYGTAYWRQKRMGQDWGPQTKSVPFLFGSNTVFRKTVLQEVNLYNSVFNTNYEDVDISRRITKSGYELLYIPNAKSFHLKTDSLFSLFKRFWSWNFNFLKENGFYENFSKINSKISENIGHGCRLVKEDIAANDRPLLYYDFFMPFFVCLLDLLFYFSEFKPKRCEKEFSILSGGLALADLSYFEKTARQATKGKTLMREKYAMEINIYFMIICFINFLMHEKIDEPLRMVMIEKFLFFISTDRKTAQWLAPAVFGLSKNKKNWDDFLNKKQSLVESEVFQHFSKVLHEMYHSLFFEYPQLSDLLVESFKINEG